MSHSSVRYVKLVIDLGGTDTWFNCDSYQSPSYCPVPCGTNRCKTLKGLGCRTCDGPARPRCTNNTCGSNFFDPYTNSLYAEGYATDRLTTSDTDGAYIHLSYDFNSYAFSCADPALLKNFIGETTGMVGLGRTKSSLPRQLSAAFKLPYKFALCLPSSADKGLGDIFIGGGPYYTMPSRTGGDLARLLATTPLLINPVSTVPSYRETDSSAEYFIGVRTITIDSVIVPFNSSLLRFDKDGYGGTKLSTIDRYTVMHNSIYEAFARTYIRLAASKNIVSVAPVRPFRLCFNGKAANGSVPHVDLVLQSESVKWRFNEANLMVKVNKDVMCLGIIDGGEDPRTAIVLGGYQLENYLLEFDLVSLNLGFTSSLLQMNTSCSSHSRLFKSIY